MLLKVQAPFSLSCLCDTKSCLFFFGGEPLDLIIFMASIDTFSLNHECGDDRNQENKKGLGEGEKGFLSRNTSIMKKKKQGIESLNEEKESMAMEREK